MAAYLQVKMKLSHRHHIINLIMTDVNLTISASPERQFNLALILTITCILELVFFFDPHSSNISPAKMKLGRGLELIMVIATIYHWAKYFQLKKHLLIINNQSMTWGYKKNMHSFHWHNVDKLEVIDLATIGKEKGWLYEITLQKKKPSISGPLAIRETDFQISHQALIEIFKRFSVENNFQLNC